MPLEINEIAISMQVSDSIGEPQTRRPEQEGEVTPPAELDRERLVQDCVRRVLQALKAGGER